MADTENQPTVSEKVEDTQNVEKTEENDNPKVFVGNLPFKTTEEELKEAFDKFGGVVSANIITRGPRSLGYGFVEFETIESANKAIAEMHQTELKDRPINVELARARVETEKKPRKKKPRRGKGGKKGAKKVEGEEQSEGDNKETKKPRKKKPKRAKPDLSDRTPSTTTLFVANLPFSTTDEELKEVFSDANATSAYVVRRRNNSSKGYGFVEFANEDDQKKGLAKDKSSIDEREISVKIALQQPEKEEEEEVKVKEEVKEEE